MITLESVYKDKPIALGVVEFLFELLMERPAKANISHVQPPSYEQHERFVRSRPYRDWFLIVNEESYFVGSVYLTNQNEIGIAVHTQFQHRGYAIQALHMARKIPPLPGIPGRRSSSYVAHVAANNEESHALFTKAGGRLLSMTYVL